MKFRSVFAGIIGTLILSSAGLSQNAYALSCMQPDLIRTLEDAKSSDKVYYILVGKFTSEPHKVKPYNFNHHNPKPPKVIRSWFEGYSVAQDPRYDSHLTRFPVDIQTSCAGPWCSSPPANGHEFIAFVQARESQAPLLNVSPCPTWVFPAKDKQVQKIRQCLDKSCTPEASPY